MPTPRSLISSNTPPEFSKCPDTATGVSAAENDVAFSTSSASKCTTSLTACPRTAIPGCTFKLTRSNCSISDTAARSTSTKPTACVHRRLTSCPANTSKFSLLRRIRVAK